MAEARATVSERRRISAIWLVPIVALVLGIWMVIHTLRSQGPEITIVFSSGASIEAGKTKIKFREVEVGLGGAVGGHEGVVVGEAEGPDRIDSGAEPDGLAGTHVEDAGAAGPAADQFRRLRRDAKRRAIGV